jgi:glycosyltransferase involved in cell wall biosynthesis
LVNRGLEPGLLSTIVRQRNDVVLHASYYDLARAHEAYPLVVTVHDLIHERRAHARSPEVAAKLRACARADLIVAVSEYTRSELIEVAGISPERIRVCHHGTTVLKPAEGTLRSLARSRPFVLYVGKRNGYKNFARLLDAYAASRLRTAGIGLVAFGGGPALADELAHVASLGLRDLVSFRQGGDADLAAYYRTAQLFVYPSLDEGFGLPVLEAMAHSCPVVAAAAGAIPEVAADAAHLFEPTDVDAIGAALDDVFFDSKLRLELVACGRRRSAQFTWAQTARQMLEVYADASANHRVACAAGGAA